MTEPKCWFYRAKTHSSEYFLGAFRPHLLWLDDETTVLIFYIDQGIPKTVRFSCSTQTFFQPTTLDFTALGTELFDFFIQKAFIFQNRLLLVKNCLRGEKTPLLISDSAIARLYPVKLEISFDMLHSAVAFDGVNIYVFGGLSLDTGKPTNDLYKIDLCCLKILKLQADSPSAPSPRCHALTQIVGEELFVFGGLLESTNAVRQAQSEGISSFNFKKNKWEKFSMGNFQGLEIKAFCNDSEKILLLAKNPEACCYLFKASKRVGFRTLFANQVRIPFGVGSQVSLYFSKREGNHLDLRRHEHAFRQAERTFRRFQIRSLGFLRTVLANELQGKLRRRS